MIKLPEELARVCHRNVMIDGVLGDEYNEYHALLAQIDIDSRSKSEFVVVEDHGLQNTGWFDGVKVRIITAAVKCGVLGWKCRKLRWNHTGAWFERQENGHGWSRFMEMTEHTKAVTKTS